jgi:hypothetical protein
VSAKGLQRDARRGRTDQEYPIRNITRLAQLEIFPMGGR